MNSVHSILHLTNGFIWILHRIFLLPDVNKRQVKIQTMLLFISMNNHLPPHPHPWGTIVLNHYVTVPVTVKFIINTMWTWYIRLKKPSCVSNGTRHKNTDYIFKTVAKSTFPVSFEKTGRITRASEQQLFLKLENLSFSIFKRESRILYLMYNCI